MSAAVREAVERAVGVRFQVEGTGGGCTALVANLEGGFTLVMTDGNFGHEIDAEGASFDAGVYAPGTWNDGGQDALVNDWADEQLSPDDAARRVVALLGEVAR